jgi:glycosyltransferase involved in cell wall biosynthesis
VPNVLLLLPSLDYGGAARQTALLARGLAGEGVGVRVCALGGPAPWADGLAAAGVSVDVLGWRRPFDVLPLARLRRLLRSFRPDVIHVWGPAALRAVAAFHSPARLLVSAALPPGGRPGVVDRWLLRHADGILATGLAQAERYRRLGVAAQRLHVLPPGVTAPEAGTAAAAPGLAPEARVVLGVGPLAPHKGFRDAIWAFDILRFLYDDLRLVLLGEGPGRAGLEHFARAAGVAHHVHFLGAVPSVGPWLERAVAVWVPSLRPAGVGAALEAMAAGRPVVASDLPELREVVADGETGLLFKPGDKAALARQTRRLLDGAGLRWRLADAAREYAGRHFAAARAVRQATRLYDAARAGTAAAS